METIQTMYIYTENLPSYWQSLKSYFSEANGDLKTRVFGTSGKMYKQ